MFFQVTAQHRAVTAPMSENTMRKHSIEETVPSLSVPDRKLPRDITCSCLISGLLCAWKETRIELFWLKKIQRASALKGWPWREPMTIIHTLGMLNSPGRLSLKPPCLSLLITLGGLQCCNHHLHTQLFIHSVSTEYLLCTGTGGEKNYPQFPPWGCFSSSGREAQLINKHIIRADILLVHTVWTGLLLNIWLPSPYIITSCD